MYYSLFSKRLVTSILLDARLARLQLKTLGKRSHRYTVVLALIGIESITDEQPFVLESH